MPMDAGDHTGIPARLNEYGVTNFEPPALFWLDHFQNFSSDSENLVPTTYGDIFPILTKDTKNHAIRPKCSHAFKIIWVNQPFAILFEPRVQSPYDVIVH